MKVINYTVECYNSVTESTTQEVRPYTSHQQALHRAASQNKKHGSANGLHGPAYYVVEVDEDGNSDE